MGEQSLEIGFLDGFEKPPFALNTILSATL